MFNLNATEQLKMLADSHRDELAAHYGRQGPSRFRPAVASLLRRLANRLDRPGEQPVAAAEPIRVLRLPTSELGNGRFIDVVIS